MGRPAFGCDGAHPNREAAQARRRTGTVFPRRDVECGSSETRTRRLLGLGRRSRTERLRTVRAVVAAAVPHDRRRNCPPAAAPDETEAAAGIRSPATERAHPPGAAA